jgi:putative addiction module CopG family antidote
MIIRLSEQDEAKIREKVEAGLYRDAEEAMHVALLLLDERDAQLEWLNAAIDPAQEQFDKGLGIELTRERFDEIVARGVRAAKNAQMSGNARRA